MSYPNITAFPKEDVYRNLMNLEYNILGSTTRKSLPIYRTSSIENLRIWKANFVEFLTYRVMIYKPHILIYKPK